MSIIAEKKFRVFMKNTIISKVSSNHDLDIIDDIVQDSLIKVIIAINKGKVEFKNLSMFHSWVALIVLNTYIDMLRKKTRDRKKFINQDFMNLDDRYNLAANDGITGEFHDEDVAVVVDAVNELPSEQQEIIEYIAHKGYMYKEVVEETGIGMNTLLGRMRYARKNLKKKLDAE